MSRFRDWNEKQCLRIFEWFFGEPDEDARMAYRKQPYSWLFVIFVPIAGLILFDGLRMEQSWIRRRREMDERRAKLAEYHRDCWQNIEEMKQQNAEMRARLQQLKQCPTD